AEWRSTFDIVALDEPLFRNGTRIIRAFSEQTGVLCRSLSRPLQRVITDFGSDLPFGQVNGKLQEHYGIEVPVSAVRMITEHCPVKPCTSKPTWLAIGRMARVRST
ncbi:MAG: hypothetical protein L0Y38_12220, partial [Methylococcaceae bacterium]|nr:hypothetical protein [Methylococcaceae bacterium]